MVIDGHCHVWPDAIADQALSLPVEDLRRFADGKVSSLIADMDRAGVDRAICLAVADSPRRLDGANHFVASLPADRFVGFGSVHPGASVAENLDSLRRHGLRGVKVHPLFQHYRLDDPALGEILDALQGEFVATIHVGEGGTPEENERCTPQMLAALCRRFPRLEVIACHFGGYKLLDEVEEIVVGLPVTIDTSWSPSLAVLDPARVRSIIERHGPDRVVFGSDWPMADPAAEIAAIEALGLAADDVEAVLGGNLQRLLA
ncbi:MAG TPA: amidohydrolase family protein [Solirubrobacterales bacterium]|nr:amidohydrolase family protein [Solirubrobacterales bacterium]